MNEYETIVNIVESVLICGDEKFKEFLAPHLNKALEDHTRHHYLSWGYDDDDTPLERLKEYWGDMIGEEDPDAEINIKECKSIRECHKEDIQKIEKFIYSEAIKIEEFKMIDHGGKQWIYDILDIKAIDLVQRYVDTTLNVNILKDDINAILISARFKHFISKISNENLVKILQSEWSVHDYEYATSDYIKINNYTHYFTHEMRTSIMNEIAKRLKGDE